MKINTLIPVLLALSTVTACANPPLAQQDATARAQAGGGPPRQDLTPQLLYQYLLGEIAGQRGELTLASEAYLDLAYKTRDLRIVKRAAEVAIFARKPANALKATELWLQLEPDSLKARQTYVSLLIGAGRLNDARPHLEALLKQGGRPLGEAFLQLPGLLLRHQDKQAVLALVSDLAAAYPLVPEASFALAQVAWHAGQHERALQAAEEALRLKPGWEAVALFYGQVLQRKGDEAVANYWLDFMSRYPDAREVRLALARQLARMNRFAESRSQFEVLLNQMPGQPDVLVALGLLAMQMNDLDASERYLKDALRQETAEEDQVKLYLGRLGEARRRYEEALSWYQGVEQGRHYFEAQLQAAVVLGKLGRVAEGRELLAKLGADTDADKVQVIQAEAQMLREAKDYQQVYEVLTRGLESMPQSPELLYDRAMAAERVGRLDVLEKDLRQLIKMQPEHAHAYNALGYTLADRTERIAEAIELLNKAIKLAPHDPFIMDSMGWAYFKAKRFDEAVDFLKRAYAARPDPEIAAHLGEVLWVKGDRDEARRIWQGSIKEHPDNESLRETLTRLQP